jgi:glycine oxidase
MRAGIAGGGVAGQLLALALSDAGWQVSLFDHGRENSCSMAAAGLLAPTEESIKSDAIVFQMGMESIHQHWPGIVERLPKEILFQKTGSLLVAHPQDEIELTQFIRRVSATLGNQLNHKKLDQEAIKTLEPGLEKFHHGYYFKDEGFIDNQTLLLVLSTYLENKITWHENKFVNHIEPHKIFIGDDTHVFDMVFDCRGLGAKSTFNALRGMRGEVVWLQAPDVHITRPVRILHPRYSVYIAPRANHTYVVGATEIESEKKDAISVRGMLELLTAVFYLHPGFSEARIVKTVTQCRPVLPDNLPSIKYTEGFLAVNGLYRNGFLLAPTLVADMVSWVQKGMSQVRYPDIWKSYT